MTFAKKEMLLETHCKYNTIHVLDGIKNNKQHVKIFFVLFYPYIHSPDSHENEGGVTT